MKRLCVPILLCIALLVVSCGKPKGEGDLDILISYTANSQPMVVNTLAYTNEAGNRFLVTEIQWFLSNIALEDEDGHLHTLSRYAYIDTNIPESQAIKATQLPCGHYTALHFTFGLDQDDNITGQFVNPPESNMFWPEPLGGGYHYMKLNGKYLDEDDLLVPLNIHLGIGQNSTHTKFYQNYFTVDLPLDLHLEANTANHLYLIMDIDHWFCSPHIYDFNTYGSAIMQNQEAQNILKENGNDVFSVTTTNTYAMSSFADFYLNLMKYTAPQPQYFTWEKVKKTFSEFKIVQKEKL